MLILIHHSLMSFYGLFLERRKPEVGNGPQFSMIRQHCSLFTLFSDYSPQPSQQHLWESTHSCPQFSVNICFPFNLELCTGLKTVSTSLSHSLPRLVPFSL